MHPPEIIAAAKLLGVELPDLPDTSEAHRIWAEWQVGPLKAAWKAAAKIHHPDVGGDSAKFTSLSSAYDLLRNASVEAEETEESDIRFLREALLRAQRSADANARVAMENHRRRLEQEAEHKRTRAEMAARMQVLEKQAAALAQKNRELQKLVHALQQDRQRLSDAVDTERELTSVRKRISAQRLQKPKPPPPPTPGELPMLEEETSDPASEVLDAVDSVLRVTQTLGLDKLLGVSGAAQKVRRAIRR